MTVDPDIISKRVGPRNRFFNRIEDRIMIGAAVWARFTQVADSDKKPRPFVEIDISQLSNLNRPPYLNDLLDPIEFGICRRESRLLACSVGSVLHLMLRDNHSGPIPRRINPCLTPIINVSFDHDGHSRCTNTGGPRKRTK